MCVCIYTYTHTSARITMLCCSNILKASPPVYICIYMYVCRYICEYIYTYTHVSALIAKLCSSDILKAPPPVSARNISWNLSGVEPVHCKRAHIDPGSSVIGTNWKMTVATMVQIRQKTGYGVETPHPRSCLSGYTNIYIYVYTHTHMYIYIYI